MSGWVPFWIPICCPFLLSRENNLTPRSFMPLAMDIPISKPAHEQISSLVLPIPQENSSVWLMGKKKFPVELGILGIYYLEAFCLLSRLHLENNFTVC